MTGRRLLRHDGGAVHEIERRTLTEDGAERSDQDLSDEAFAGHDGRVRLVRRRRPQGRHDLLDARRDITSPRSTAPSSPTSAEQPTSISTSTSVSTSTSAPTSKPTSTTTAGPRTTTAPTVPHASDGWVVEGLTTAADAVGDWTGTALIRNADPKARAGDFTFTLTRAGRVVATLSGSATMVASNTRERVALASKQRYTPRPYEYTFEVGFGF